MSNVVDLESRRPHFSGECICSGCGHKWIAVAPMTADKEMLECPSCRRNLGMTKAPFVPETFFECKCGSSLFYVTHTGVQCRKCGNEPELSELWA